MMFRYLFFTFLLILVGPSCTDSPASQESGLSDFETFYNRFLTDSLYQLAHINFPIDGIPDNALKNQIPIDGFQWQRYDWVLHRPINFEQSGFQRELTSIGESLVVERLIHESGKYGMMRRFAKQNGEWYLIYYAGLNPLAGE